MDGLTSRFLVGLSVAAICLSCSGKDVAASVDGMAGLESAKRLAIEGELFLARKQLLSIVEEAVDEEILRLANLELMMINIRDRESARLTYGQVEALSASICTPQELLQVCHLLLRARQQAIPMIALLDARDWESREGFDGRVGKKMAMYRRVADDIIDWNPNFANFLEEKFYSSKAQLEGFSESD